MAKKIEDPYKFQEKMLKSLEKVIPEEGRKLLKQNGVSVGQYVLWQVYNFKNRAALAGWVIAVIFSVPFVVAFWKYLIKGEKVQELLSDGLHAQDVFAIGGVTFMLVLFPVVFVVCALAQKEGSYARTNKKLFLDFDDPDKFSKFRKKALKATARGVLVDTALFVVSGRRWGFFGVTSNDYFAYGMAYKMKLKYIEKIKPGTWDKIRNFDYKSYFEKRLKKLTNPYLKWGKAIEPYQKKIGKVTKVYFFSACVLMSTIMVSTVSWLLFDVWFIPLGSWAEFLASIGITLLFYLFAGWGSLYGLESYFKRDITLGFSSNTRTRYTGVLAKFWGGLIIFVSLFFGLFTAVYFTYLLFV